MEAAPADPRAPATKGRRERDVTWAGPGLLRVRQRVEVRAGEPGTDVTGPYWVFAVVRVLAGGLRYLHGRERVAPPGRCFAVFMPPWSIVRVATPAVCAASTNALASSAPLFDGAPARPLAWRWPGGELPSTERGIAQAVHGADAVVDVSLEVEPSDLARRVKGAIDETYCRPITLARLAAQAGLSSSVVSRAFKRAYGMPPVEYRHRLRVMDAMFRLASGGEILTVVQEVGFGDASRLYGHFRSLLCEPPGAYSARRSRNAKT